MPLLSAIIPTHNRQRYAINAITMPDILRSLRDAGGFVNFVDLFDVTQGAQVLVVHFLAMLELAREHLLEMTQAEAFAPIYVRLSDGRVEHGSDQPDGREDSE